MLSRYQRQQLGPVDIAPIFYMVFALKLFSLNLKKIRNFIMINKKIAAYFNDKESGLMAIAIAAIMTTI